MFAEHLIVPGSLRNVFDSNGAIAGFAVAVRLNWFRSLPLSCLAGLSIAVDNAAVSPEDIVLATGQDRVPLCDAGEHDELWWSCRDAITILVSDNRGLAPGQHEVGIELRVRIPYFPPASPDLPWPTMYDRITRTESIA